MQKNIEIKYNKGSAMIIVVFFFVFISLTILIGIVTPVVREFQIASDNYSSKKSYFIAESGVEDVMYRIKNSMEIGTIGTERTLYIDGYLAPIPTELTDIGGGQKQIITTGSVNSNERTVGLKITTATGVSFNYGVLVGQGGIELMGVERSMGIFMLMGQLQVIVLLLLQALLFLQIVRPLLQIK